MFIWATLYLWPVSPKNNSRLRLFFDRKTGGCIVAGHVKKNYFVKKIIATGYNLLVKLASGQQLFGANSMKFTLYFSLVNQSKHLTPLFWKKVIIYL